VSIDVGSLWLIPPAPKSGGPYSRRSQDHYARHSGTAPLPVWSGNRQSHRLAPTGCRQLNSGLHRIAVMQGRCHPDAPGRHRTTTRSGQIRGEGTASAPASPLERHPPRPSARRQPRPHRPVSATARTLRSTPTRTSASGRHRRHRQSPRRERAMPLATDRDPSPSRKAPRHPRARRGDDAVHRGRPLSAADRTPGPLSAPETMKRTSPARRARTLRDRDARRWGRGPASGCHGESCGVEHGVPLV
jgi:Transposase IS116/IS110/IS902 family